MKKKSLSLLVIALTAVFSIKVNAAEERDLGEIVITSTRIAQNDYKLAGNVTVINHNQIEESNAQTIPDVLKQVLGVYVYDKSTSKSSVVDIRGFGDTAKSNVLFLVNDRKINAIDLSGADLLQIPLEAVDRIEIVRGADSILYGDNAVGGVVNIITKKGKGDLSGKLDFKYGSYDSSSVYGEVSGNYKDLSYYFSSKYFDERGYRQNSDVLSKDFNSHIYYDIFNKVKMDVEVGRHEDTTDLPGGLDESEIESLGRRGSADSANVSTTKDMFYKLGFDINPWQEDMYLGDIVLNFTFRDRDVFDSFGGYDADRNIGTLGITGKYVFDKEIFNRKVNFVTGIDYYNTDNKIIGSGSNTDDIIISKDEFGIYGFLEYELFPSIFINGGTRYQKADYVFDDHKNSTYTTKGPDEWVSMGGIKYEYGNNSALYFNVQQTFRFLATDEWYSTWSGLNTDLQQQTGLQIETGIKHNFDDKIIFSLTPYYMIIDNEIYYNASSFQNQNYDKTKRIGVEAGSSVDILKFIDINFFDKLTFFANYTYQNPQFSEGTYDGKDIPLVPRHQSKTGIIMQFLNYYNLSLTGRFVGSRFIINDLSNSMAKAKPYYVMDAKLSYKRDSYELFCSINNIFDEQYSPYQIKKTSTSRDYYPAPERNFDIGINIKF